MYKLIEYDQATPQVKAIYNEIIDSLGFSDVPNFFKAQGQYPIFLNSTWNSVKQILVKAPHVSRLVKEMILVAISRATKCKYCEAAHLALCEILDYKSMLNEKDRLPARAAGLIEIAIVTSIDRDGKKAKELCEAWQVYDQEKLELVAMGALSLYLNIVADSLEVPIDESITKVLDRVNHDESMKGILAGLDRIVDKMQSINVKLKQTELIMDIESTEDESTEAE